jgi:IS30 family transposase
MPNNYSQLSLDERRTIYKLLEAGRSKTSIANYLGRHRATIFREVNHLYQVEDQITCLP